VVEVKLNTIVIDFNHPLADEDLYFTGVIAQIM
jgi:FKBP-type peptidyl-prolyl cis-trans isomerase 2